MLYCSFENVEEFKNALEGIDVTERKHVRPQDSDKQTEMYSGKKDIHDKKYDNQYSREGNKFLSNSYRSNHDCKMLKEEFPPDKPWLKDISTLLDLRYKGVQKD